MVVMHMELALRLTRAIVIPAMEEPSVYVSVHLFLCMLWGNIRQRCLCFRVLPILYQTLNHVRTRRR